MIVLRVPLEVAAKADFASSSEEQKLARGDLWKRPQYFRKYKYEDDDTGDRFYPMLKEECKKLGFELSSVSPRK